MQSLEGLPDFAAAAGRLADPACAGSVLAACAGIALAGWAANAFGLIGPNIGQDEAAIFVNRWTRARKAATSARPGVWFPGAIYREDRSIDGRLSAAGEGARFQPDSLTNGKGRLRLCNFECAIPAQSVRTRDGAIIAACASVTFRLDPDHLCGFVNFALPSFAETLAARTKWALTRVIREHDRRSVDARSDQLNRLVEEALRELVEGAPAIAAGAGLGVRIGRTSLRILDAGDAEIRLASGQAPQDRLISQHFVQQILERLAAESDPQRRAEIIDMSKSFGRQEADTIARQLGPQLVDLLGRLLQKPDPRTVRLRLDPLQQQRAARHQGGDEDFGDVAPPPG